MVAASRGGANKTSSEQMTDRQTVRQTATLWNNKMAGLLADTALDQLADKARSDVMYNKTGGLTYDLTQKLLYPDFFGLK